MNLFILDTQLCKSISLIYTVLEYCCQLLSIPLFPCLHPVSTPSFTPCTSLSQLIARISLIHIIRIKPLGQAVPGPTCVVLHSQVSNSIAEKSVSPHQDNKMRFYLSLWSDWTRGGRYNGDTRRLVCGMSALQTKSRHRDDHVTSLYFMVASSTSTWRSLD